MTEDDEEFGPAPFPDTDVDEASTQDVLTSVINSEYIKLTFETRDKYPNRDGIIEIANEKGQPVGDLVIQVKKLAEDERNPPKYQCERKYLEYSRSINPPLLFLGVDTEDRVVYWKHIDPVWVERLELGDQESKVIHFPEENVIDRSSMQYIDEWRKITVRNQQRIRNYENFQQLKEVTNPALEENRPEFETIHRFLDEYNGLLHGEFSVIRERMFPGLWKFGYANIEYTEDHVVYGLYPITWFTNDVQIKDIEVPEGGAPFDEGDLTQITHYGLKENLTQITRYGSNPLVHGIREHALRELENDFKTAISDRYLRHDVNDFLCREIIFAFVDELYEMMGLEEKGKYTLEELEHGFYTYIHFWIDSALDRIDEDPDSLSDLFGGLFPSNLLSNFFSDERQEIDEEVEKRIEGGEGLDFPYKISVDSLSDGVFDEAISALRDRGYESVERPYPSEDVEVDHDTEGVTNIWDPYSDDAFEGFVKAYWRNLPSAYQEVAEASFPDLEGVFDDFQEITDVVVEIDVEGLNERSGPLYYYHCLKGGDNDEISLHFQRMPAPDDHIIEYPPEDPVVEYERSKYEHLRGGEGSFVGMLDTAPLLSSVYSRIEEDIEEEYFDDI